MLDFLKAPFLYPVYIHDLSYDVTCNIVIYADDTIATLCVIRHLICGSSYRWLLILNLIYETLQTGGRKWLVDFNAGKTQLVSFDRSNKNIGAIDVKMDGLIFEENTPFKMLGLSFSSKSDWGSYIISIPKKLELDSS